MGLKCNDWNKNKFEAPIWLLMSGTGAKQKSCLQLELCSCQTTTQHCKVLMQCWILHQVIPCQLTLTPMILIMIMIPTHLQLTIMEVVLWCGKCAPTVVYRKLRNSHKIDRITFY